MNQDSYNKTQFDMFYKENINIVYKTALIYSDNDEKVASKVVQNAFLQVYLYLHSMNPKSVKSWLITTVRLEAIHHVKKKSGVRTMNMPGKVDIKDDLFYAIYNKNPIWYKIITLTKCLDVSKEEVAEELKFSVEVVDIMLNEALQWVEETYLRKE